MTGRRVASGERCGDLLVPGSRSLRGASSHSEASQRFFSLSLPLPTPGLKCSAGHPQSHPGGLWLQVQLQRLSNPPHTPLIPPHSPPFGESKKSKQETYFLCAMQNRHLEHSPVTMVTLCFLNREERRRWRPHWEGSVASGEDPARRVVREKLGTLLVQSACVSVCVGVW